MVDDIERQNHAKKRLLTARTTSESHAAFAQIDVALAQIDVAAARFPYCIVWTPIPLITFVAPFIGHLGIANSQGIIYDFAGPYTISIDHFSFGPPTRYVQLNSEDIDAETWDSCVLSASEVYSHRMHNLFCDNCHSHVACALNRMQLRNYTTWNMVKLAAMVFFFGKHTNLRGVLWTWLPSLLLYTGIAIFFCYI